MLHDLAEPPSSILAPIFFWHALIHEKAIRNKLVDVFLYAEQFNLSVIYTLGFKIFVRMKKIIVFALLAFSTSSFAQDYCKQIKKEVTDNNRSFSYETPYDENKPPAIRAVRSYSTVEDNEFDNFSLVLTIPCEFSDLLAKTADGGEAEMEESKIVIEFDDKSKITDDTTMVTHDKKGDGSALRVAYFTVTPQNIKVLTTKKIAKFHLAKADQVVTDEMAVAIQKYLLCLNDVKK